MKPKFDAGDRVFSTMNGHLYGVVGTVKEVLPGRGGQRFVYLVAIETELPETALHEAPPNMITVLT